MPSRHYPLITAACLAAISMTHAQVTAPSQFWTKAKKTLKLSELRMPAVQQHPRLDDPVLASPNFLPLCGNGRIDTKADYATFYKETKYPPLNVTLQQLFSGWNLSGIPNSGQTFGVTLAADEECDDGNRLDFDGCSADCMHMDLWTSACGLMLNHDKELIMEDIMYDPVRECMVLSASDGLYALKVGLGDSFISMILLANKTLPMVKIYRQSNSIILYSSEQQSLWQLKDNGNSITLLRSFPELENMGLFYPPLDSFQWDDGSIVVRDSKKMLYLENITSSKPRICNFGTQIHKCIHVQNNGKNKVFHCDFTEVEIGPGKCLTAYMPSMPSFQQSSNIWYELFQLVSSFTATINTAQKYAYGDATGNFDNANEPSIFNIQPISIEAYHPMGGFMELTIADPRKLQSEITDIIPYYIGEPSLLQALLSGTKADNTVCSTDSCVFDNTPGYDITLQNPSQNLNSVSMKTWNDILQEIIDAEANTFPKLNNLADVHADPQRYMNIVASFIRKYEDLMMPTAVVKTVKHPITKNIWALGRGEHQLIEISTSGVQLRRPDGLCVPSGVALCPKCQWAPSGQPCRPCSQSDKKSWSWNAVCNACPSSGSSRRLLSDGSSTVNITFVVKGNLEFIKSKWPEAVYDPATDLITVNVVTSDSIASMRYIKSQLLYTPQIRVITPPYVAVDVGTVASTTTTSKSTPDNTAVIVLAVVLPSLLIVGIVSIYSYRNTNGQKLAAHYRPVHPVYYLKR